MAVIEAKHADPVAQHQRPNRPGWQRYVYLEPALFLYAIGDFMNYTILQQYAYYRVAEELGLPVDHMMEQSEGCVSMNNSTNSTFEDIENKVLADTAIVNLGISMFIHIPAVITSLFFGAWTDKNGRRTALFSPVIGSIAHCIIQLLVMYLDLPVYVLFLASFVDGCSGYIPTMKQTSMAYVVDITSEFNRIFRVGFLQFLVFMSGVIGYLISGYWIEIFGFEAPTWFILSCQIVCFLYLLVLPESRPKAPDAPRFLSFDSFKTMWRVFTKHRRNRGRKVLGLLMTCSGIVILAVLGIDGIITLYYLASPLCFSSVMIGYMYSYYTLALGSGAVILTSKQATRYLSEFKLAVLGALATIVSMVWLAFSRNRWMIYVAPIISFFGGAMDPVLKGWMSKIVSLDEEGAMFAVVTTIETIALAFGMFMFNPIYAALVNLNFGGGTFLVSGGLAIIPLVIICCIRKEISVMEQKQHTKIQLECKDTKERQQNDTDRNSEGHWTTHL